MIYARTFIISIIAILGTLYFYHNIKTGSNVQVVNKNLDKLPKKVMDYTSQDIEMAKLVRKELDTDVYLYRRYLKNEIDFIDLYIGYYGTKKGGRTGHNPRACYPASGWGLVNEKKVNIQIIYDNSTKIIKVNSLMVAKNQMNELVYHWYQSSRDKVLPSGISQNIHRFKEKIIFNRNDGAFIRVSTRIEDKIEDAEKRIKLFIKKIFPLIVKYWPEENEIN